MASRPRRSRRRSRVDSPRNRWALPESPLPPGEGRTRDALASWENPPPARSGGEGRAHGDKSDRTLIIACGALAREILALIERNGWTHLDITCLPASLHNRPDQIPGRLRTAIAAAQGRYRDIVVAYGDCGTAGAIDAVLDEAGIERFEGPHCYAAFAGGSAFDALMDEEPGSFFLTDYLVRQFDTLIIRGLGLDRHPQLQSAYFGNYRRLIYLAQTDDPALTEAAIAAAERLGLAFERRYTGYGELAPFLERTALEPVA